jgi:uncharacterized protein YqgC (DUF456 family)
MDNDPGLSMASSICGASILGGSLFGTWGALIGAILGGLIAWRFNKKEPNS